MSGLGTRLELLCIATILKPRAATTELNLANLVEMQRERKDEARGDTLALRKWQTCTFEPTTYLQ